MFKRLSALVGAASLALSILIAPAAQAAGPDDLLNVGDGVCDFAAAGLGRGSASNPFSISSPKQLAEMTDCSVRQFSVTNAVGNGTSVTFTADHSFGVGQVVNLDSVDPANYNLKAARITSVTDTSFTVSSTITDAYNGGGTVTDTHSYYSIDADINLAAGTESWNLVQEATITNAVGDGSSVVYTAANNFTVGQSIIIEGVNPNTFSLGRATVTAADANSFTVSSGVTDSFVSGGMAYSNGWQPIVGRNGRFEQGTIFGNGHTISNLTIHRNEGHQGLFGTADYTKIKDLNLTNVMVSSAGDQWVDRAAGLAASASYSSFENISVSGTVHGRFRLGLLAGYLFADASNIEVSGFVRARSTTSGNDDAGNIGGVAGIMYGVATNIVANVDVDGMVRRGSTDPTARVGFGQYIGGAFGRTDGAFRNIESHGDVIGNAGVGGVFGYNCCGDIVDTFATGDVYGESSSNNNTISSIGGNIGEWDCCGAVRDSYATGDVIIINTNANAQIEYVGGFAGTNWCCGLMVNSYATGDVIIDTDGPAAHAVGGFLGVYDCCNNLDGVYATGDITVNNGYQVGGLIGWIDSSESGIENAYYEGNITVGYDGEARVGGLIGEVRYDITVSNSYANANVTVTPVTPGSTAGTVGGLVGYVTDMLVLRDSYFRGTVSGTYLVAGLVGYNTYGLVDIQRSYVSATVTDNSVDPVRDSVANGAYTDVHGTAMYDTTVAGDDSTATGMLGMASSEIKDKDVLDSLGWKFNEDGGPWQLAADLNDGFPHLVRPNYGGSETEPQLPAATLSWAPITKVTTVTKAPSVLATSNSAGAITYAVTDAGTTGCTVNPTTGALTFVAAGNCVVTATVASDGTYAETSVAVTFAVTKANCKAVNLGNVNFAKGSASLNGGSRKQVAAYVTAIVSRGCGAVVLFGRGATTALAKQRAFVVKNALMARLAKKGVAVRFVTKWTKVSANTVGLVGQNK